MKRFGVLLAIALVLTAAVGAQGGAVAASSTLCGNTYGGDFVTPHRVSCKRALSVVRNWGHGFKRDGVVDREARGFQCTGRHEPIEGLIVTCRRGRKSVTFFANAP